MSNDTNASGSSSGVSEELLRRPMGGFSPSSPSYRPLPPVRIPPAPPPGAAATQATAPSAALLPSAQAARPSAPISARAPLDPPTLPEGVPTPGRIPAQPAYRAGVPYRPGFAPAPASRPLPAPAPPSRPLPVQVAPSHVAPPVYPPYGYAVRARPDLSAVAVEAVGAVFGLYGLGWLMTGRASTGILLLLGGLLWDIVALGLISTGIGIACFLPLHAVFIILTTVSLSNYIKSRG